MIRLLVGLGNPGKKYEKTRHNVGFMVIDEILRRLKAPKPTEECLSLVYKVSVNGKGVILAKPQTYMNNSGLAVINLLEEYDIKPEEMLVVYDDLDLRLGKLRLRLEGSSGGHHGVESIIREIKTEKFPRLKIGIGRPKDRNKVVDYVLSPFLPFAAHLPSLFIVAYALIYLLVGKVHSLKLFHLYPLTRFKLFVVFKKVFYPIQKGLWQVLVRLYILIGGVYFAVWHSQKLCIYALFIPHLKGTYGPAPYNATWCHSIPRYYQNIHRVAIICQSLGYKAIVKGIMHGGKEEPIHKYGTTFLVKLILNRAVLRYFNYHINILWWVFPRWYFP